MSESKIEDGAEEVAETAYRIFRGMTRADPKPPAWTDLSPRNRGMMTWIVRFAWMKKPK